MHHVIKVKPVVMTIIHIAEEEDLGTLQEENPVKTTRKHAFGLHAVQSGRTCDSNP